MNNKKLCKKILWVYSERNDLVPWPCRLRHLITRIYNTRICGDIKFLIFIWLRIFFIFVVYAIFYLLNLCAHANVPTLQTVHSRFEWNRRVAFGNFGQEMRRICIYNSSLMLDLKYSKFLLLGKQMHMIRINWTCCRGPCLHSRLLIAKRCRACKKNV